LDHVPKWTQDGLLVLGGKVSLDEKKYQISVLYDLVEPEIKQFVLRAYDGRPLLIRVMSILWRRVSCHRLNRAPIAGDVFL
jgi:hypothetical protein